MHPKGIKVHVEVWNHKRRVVARSNGKILSYARYSSKIGLYKYISIYKENNTFVEGTKKVYLRTKNYNEHSDTRIYPQKPRQKVHFAYFVSFEVEGLRKGVSSRYLEWPSVKAARMEAYDRLKMKVWEHFYGNYDYDEQQINDYLRRIIIIEEGIRWYR